MLPDGRADSSGASGKAIPRSRSLRSGMDTKGVEHRMKKQFPQIIAERSGGDILALWDRWGDHLDVRCAGTALRNLAKRLAEGAQSRALGPAASSSGSL
mmetsp:Transcript_128941/g.412919  ORF Transcript_128941/g.412919 Transcript_128941/m.412919 type:complete len:99 (-) Transcript_128941:407-703(-)